MISSIYLLYIRGLWIKSQLFSSLATTILAIEAIYFYKIFKKKHQKKRKNTTRSRIGYARTRPGLKVVISTVLKLKILIKIYL